MSQTLDIDALDITVDAARVSLAEMLVAFALCGAIFAATYGALDAGYRAHAIGAARVESQQAARAALVRLAREIRVTGVGADQELPAITTAGAAQIVLASDLDADGVVLARGEVITWQLVGSVLRRNAGAGAQPVSNGVRTLQFRYLDGTGAVTSDPAAVRMVEAVVTAEHAGTSSSLAQGVATQLSTRARLRNR